MAENLRFVETLDHSNFDKGIADSTNAIRKLSEDAQLASKGLKGMFDTPAMKQAEASFQGVQKAVEDYTRAMSRDLPMKTELRETQKAAMQLESSWRALSDAEKASAAGQELRQKIDMLIQRGGQLKDTMIDVGNAMKFQASDTAKLDAVVGGIQALTAAAQVAASAMAMLGMEQKDAATIQKDLMAVMGMLNGLQTIQNLLQKESALMMGLAAAKTAAYSAAVSVKAAVTKGDTIATKAAAVAQWAWNAALAANPIGLAITAVAALSAGLYILYNRLTQLTDAQKGAKQAQEQFNAAQAQAAQNTAKAVLELEHYINATKTFNGSAEEEKRLLDEINGKYGEQIGYMTSLADAKQHMAELSGLYIEMLRAEARASALAAAYGDTYAKMITGEVSIEEGKATMEALDKAFQKNKQLADYIAQGLRDVARLQGRQITVNPVTAKTPSTRPDTRTPRAATSPGVVAEKGSLAWFEQEIKKRQELADATADLEKRERLLAEAQELTRQKKYKYTNWQESFDFGTQSLVEKFNANLDKIGSKIKPMRIPVTFEDPVAAAKAKSDQLLKNTEGLRTAAMAAAGAFRNMGTAIGGAAGQAVNVAGIIAQAIATLIQGYATATASAAGTGNPWVWMAFALSGLAEVMSVISAVKNAAGYATGGIVGGTSYSGDKQLIRVNSGEMILNAQQQARLFSMINSGTAVGKVEFEIAGQKLRGVLNNFDSKTAKVR